jgi:hypothetical protein
MSLADTAPAGEVPWQDLQDAFGPASEVPRLLDKVARSHGRKLQDALGELCERVLHQGTIYSASPAVVRATIEFARAAEPAEKEAFYSLLTGFASSARKAISDGRAIPCCSGGDPADGGAIRDAILGAHLQFAADLTHAKQGIRAGAAELTTAFAEAAPADARSVRDRFFVETEGQVRGVILTGLFRVRTSFEDWPDFLNAALQREMDPHNRFTLRHAQVIADGPTADPSTVDDLVSTFARTFGTYDHFLGGERFFEAIHLLGVERELAAMLQALDQATGRSPMLVLSERMLRLTFEDQRSGWGQTAYSLLREDGTEPPGISLPRSMLPLILQMLGMLILAKLFPFLVRRKVRKLARTPPKGIPKIEYWGLKGDPPAIPRELTAAQRSVLSACASKEALWQFRTNLWQLFGLPGSADGLRRLAGSHV